MFFFKQREFVILYAERLVGGSVLRYKLIPVYSLFTVSFEGLDVGLIPPLAAFIPCSPP